MTDAGNVPPKADLGQLEGLEAIAAGASDVPMLNGGKFDGAKAYKDSKASSGMRARLSWSSVKPRLLTGCLVGASCMHCLFFHQ